MNHKLLKLIAFVLVFCCLGSTNGEGTQWKVLKNSVEPTQYQHFFSAQRDNTVLFATPAGTQRLDLLTGKNTTLDKRHWRFACGSESGLFVVEEKNQVFVQQFKGSIKSLAQVPDLQKYRACQVFEKTLYLYGQDLRSISIDNPGKQQFFHDKLPLAQIYWNRGALLLEFENFDGVSLASQFRLLDATNFKHYGDYVSTTSPYGLFFSQQKNAYFIHWFNIDKPDIIFLRLDLKDFATDVSTIDLNRPRKNCKALERPRAGSAFDISVNERVFIWKQDSCGDYIEKFDLSGKSLGEVLKFGSSKDVVYFGFGIGVAVFVRDNHLAMLDLNTGQITELQGATSHCCKKFGNVYQNFLRNSKNLGANSLLNKLGSQFAANQLTIDWPIENIYQTPNTYIIETYESFTSWVKR